MFQAIDEKLRDCFDSDVSEDVSEVIDTARALEITEFDLFQRAWRAWHGEEASEKQLERHFVGYMFHQKVPGWVRHYVRLNGITPAVNEEAGGKRNIWLSLFPGNIREWGEPEVLAGLLVLIAATGLMETLAV